MPDINMQVFEEAKRNQLVTEVDIQTQVALDGHQVQLSDIANPTQSQDNVVIDRHGEFLPHWNESLDFDTWIKMSMEVAGKQVLMLRGNSNVNSASNITNTMLFGDDFQGTSIDLTKWDGETARTTVSGGVMTFIHAIADYDWLYTDNAFAQPFIMESNVNMPSSGDDMSFGITNGASNTRIAYFYKGTVPNRFYTNDGTSSYVDTNTVYGSYKTIKIKYVSGSVSFYQDGVELTNSPKTNNIPSDNLGIGIRNPSDADDYLFKWVFIRKYAAVEPTVSINIPKNITTALKSLGRAG